MNLGQVYLTENLVNYKIKGILNILPETTLTECSLTSCIQ